MTDGAGDDRLETWQQIADYLKVSPRTAQAWAAEKGLPVHRLKGEKTPVFARCSELNAWVRSREIPVVAGNGSSENSPPPAGEAPCPPAPAEPAAVRRWNPSRLTMFGSVATLVCAIGAAFAIRHGGLRQAALLRVEGPVLIAEDGSGREMWRHTFEDGLWSGNYTAAAITDTYWIGDLDGDGRPEVLFRYDSASMARESSSIFCFGEAGRVRWKFRVGRIMRDSGGEIFPPYRIVSMLALGARDMHSRVVVSSTHPSDQACQLAFLDANGLLLGEYWHPGHLFWLSADPAVPGGAPRLLAAGVNNGEHRATLVALDPMAVAGVSTPWRMRDQRFRLLDMPEAREDTVILFPRTCLSRDEPYTRVGNLEVDDHVIRVTVVESYDPTSRRTVVYEFDHGLHLRRAFLSSNYREEHLKLEHSGALKHSWREDEAALAQQLEYRRNVP